MRATEALLLSASAASTAYAASRPRGVNPEFAPFYANPKTFTCLTDPSITLPYPLVNDDYCDCPDGSDEPGTAACAHLSPYSPHTVADGYRGNGSAALPGFWCENKGHIPGYVPFANVNDGVCDWERCCDGSEEFKPPGGGKGCEDRCAGVGKEWRKADAERVKMLGEAGKRRAELVKRAVEVKRDMEEKVRAAQVEVEGGEKKLQGLEREVEGTERREKARAALGEGEGGGKIAGWVGLARGRTEALLDSLIKVRAERDDKKRRMDELESVLARFKEEYNPNFNDEGVKRAVRAWEDYAAAKKGPEASDAELDEVMRSDQENGINWDEFQSEGGSETDVLYSFENYLPPTLRLWLDAKLRDFRIMLVENGILAASSGGNESKAVSEARKSRDKAKKDLDKQRKSLSSLTDDANADFGPDDVFRALKDVCISKDAGEYTYELCFLGKTMQKPKKGGSNVNMGNFVRLETTVVDEEVRADGKGLGVGERVVMKHENGQHCWQGPNRSSMVILGCAAENEIWKVLEEEKCVYRMEVGTPAVCREEGEVKKGEVTGRDEL